MKKQFPVRRIAYDALLSAMCAVLGYISLDLGTIKLTFENLPVLLGAFLFGPMDGMLVGGIGTFLYQLLRYGLEASTPLWILPYIVSGLIAGLFRKRLLLCGRPVRFLLPLVLNGFVVTLLNTVSLYIVYRYLWSMPVEAVLAKLPLRILISIIKSAAFAVLLPPLLRVLRKFLRAGSSGK